MTPPPSPPGVRGFVIAFVIVCAVLFGGTWLVRVVEPGPVPTAVVLTLGAIALVYMAYRRWSA